MEVDLPTDTVGPVLALLGRLRAAEPEPRLGTDGNATIEAVLPTGHVAGLETRLDGLTGGRGTVAGQPAGHRPMSRPWPRRTRTDDNPYDPAEYLSRLSLR